MGLRAEGTFDIGLWEEDRPYDDRDGLRLSRVHGTKSFHGDLDGTSTVELITVYTPAGPAAYVGVERFDGALCGRRGSFVLQHNAGTRAGKPWLTWQVVEMSGTGELAGLRGEGQIGTEPGGGHSWTLDYEIP